MQFPEYYNLIQKIYLYDPLSETLGSITDGKLEFSFSDAVRIAGHGCPTVGGAFLMTLFGLKKLYPNELPVRGMIKLSLNQNKDQGTTGVIANIVGSIIGASDEGGFKGLMGQYHRNNLISFNQDFIGNLQLERLDTHQKVILEYHPEIVPGNPKSSILLEKILIQSATQEEKNDFAELWNLRLKKIMVDEFNNPNLIIMR